MSHEALERQPAHGSLGNLRRVEDQHVRSVISTVNQDADQVTGILGGVGRGALARDEVALRDARPRGFHTI